MPEETGPAHHINETRHTDYEKMIAAANPIAQGFATAMVDQRRASEEATTRRAEVQEAGSTSRARWASVALVAVAVSVCGLAGFAIANNQAPIAEKIIFGLFAFAGGLAARR